MLQQYLAQCLKLDISELLFCIVWNYLQINSIRCYYTVEKHSSCEINIIYLDNYTCERVNFCCRNFIYHRPYLFPYYAAPTISLKEQSRLNHSSLHGNAPLLLYSKSMQKVIAEISAVRIWYSVLLRSI